MDKKEKYSNSSHGSDSGSSDDDDDIDNDEKELKPYRPELENVSSQKILLLLPPKGSPNHPRTVFFLNDPKLNENKLKKNIKVVEFEITEKKYMFLYKAYKICLYV